METYTACVCVCVMCLVSAEVADAVEGLFGEGGVVFQTVTFYFDLRPVASGERQTFAVELVRCKRSPRLRPPPVCVCLADL